MVFLSCFSVVFLWCDSWCGGQTGQVLCASSFDPMVGVQSSLKLSYPNQWAVISKIKNALWGFFLKKSKDIVKKQWHNSNTTNNNGSDRKSPQSHKLDKVALPNPSELNVCCIVTKSTYLVIDQGIPDPKTWKHPHNKLWNHQEVDGGS